MGLDKIVVNTKYTPVNNIKISAIMAAMGRAKIYELLHKQIIRKAPKRVSTHTLPSLRYYKGKEVVFIDRWNIQSPSRQAYKSSVSVEEYNPDTDWGDPHFGLNQLFNATDEIGADGKPLYSYNKPYPEGREPKEGIYHDDCYLQPKMLPFTSEHMYWRYYWSGYSEGGDYVEHLFKEKDDEGNVLITDVTKEQYDITVNLKVEHRHRLVVTYTNGTIDRIDLGLWEPMDDILGTLAKVPSHEVYNYVTEYRNNYDWDTHGSVIYEESIDMPFQFTTTGVSKTTKENGWIRQYKDGTVVQYRPLEIESWGDSYNEIPGHYKVLMMMYKDTGDLVMPVSDFVKNWNDYVEIIVHENSAWWQSFLKPILVVVTMVAAVLTGGVLAIMGGILSSLGILSGNKLLMGLGAVLTAGAALYGNAVTSAAGNLMNNAANTMEMTLPTAMDMASEMSIGELFSTFSFEGFTNLANIGSNVLKAASGVLQMADGLSSGKLPEVIESTVVEASKIEFTTTLGKDDSEYDVYGQIGKQYEIY